ncbi:Gfo/Idh/MocA family protein [Nocardia brasiliensis]|uniref:Gfo/Idh/MocA family protein n=1 Tax=Nocardia brasiliensis TaxID=37326 RepID=UPI003D8F065C
MRKIGLLGTGFAQAHAAVYAARDDVEVIVFGRRTEALQWFTDSFGFATTTDLDAVFEDADIDLIDICLPTSLHAEMVLRGLAAGKHVLTELPLAADLESARTVTAAAAASDRQVFVDMFERFLPSNRLLFDAVAEEIYGPLRHLAIEMNTAPLWPGANLGLSAVPMDMMHSDFDLLVTVLGVPDTVEVVAAVGGTQSGVVDVGFGYPHASARCSSSSMMPMSYGARGGYRATFADAVLESASTQGYDGKPDSVVTVYTADDVKRIDLPGGDPYTSMIEHVLACLRAEATNLITPASALAALELTLQIDQRVNG